MIKNTRGLAHLFLIVFIAVIIGLVVWLLSSSSENETASTEKTETIIEDTEATDLVEESLEKADEFLEYKDSLNRFKFRFPLNWIILESDEEHVIVVSDDYIEDLEYGDGLVKVSAGARIGMYVDSEPSTLFDSILQPDFNSEAWFEPEETQIAGVKAVKTKFQPDSIKNLVYIFVNNGIEYSLHLSDTSNPDFEIYLPDFEAILDSFEFL